MQISVVSPVYKAAEIIPILIHRIQETFKLLQIDYEIILVNDGSPDNSWQIIKSYAHTIDNVVGVNLSRNFGQHYALTAGLANASGDWIVVMDCDLQDNPNEIIKLYTKAGEGFDIVFGRRIARKDKFVKGFISKCFYRIFDYLTDNKSDDKVANFGIYSKEVIKSYLQFNEKTRLFPLMISWLGYRQGFVDIEHGQRYHGKSSYSFSTLFRLGLDAIISQSNKPLRMFIAFGFLMAFFSFFFLSYLVCQKFLYNVALGWTSIMVSIFFIGGLIFGNLGLIGIYIGKIYDEVKDRPIYVVSEVVRKSIL